MMLAFIECKNGLHEPTADTAEETEADLPATETGSGRIRAFSRQCLTVSSDAVTLSLSAASQRGTGVWVRRVVPAVSCRDLEPHHLVSHLILKPGIRKISLSWSPVTESNRRPSPYHAWRFRRITSR